MHIVHISSELAPIAKVGGLADVVYGLTRELIRLGHKAEVILPKYDNTDYSKIKNLHIFQKELISFDGPATFMNTIWQGELDGIKLYLIEPHHPGHYFSRGSIYGCSDDIERFLYFTRAAMEFLFKAFKKIDILQLHDWPTCIASTLYKDMYTHLGMQVQKTILTIHNIEHQGRCCPADLFRIGLNGDYYLQEHKFQDEKIPQVINLLKGGIIYADAITTVSPTYAKEVLTKEGGCGLENVLLQHKNKLTGILNGIDYTFWNPQTDPHLVKNFRPAPSNQTHSIEDILQAKQENKEHLQVHFGLTKGSFPLFCCITRLVAQKSPQLIASAIRYTIQRNAQFLLLGSEYSPQIQELFTKLSKEFSSTKQLGILLDKDESIAHQMFAGSDFFVIPSLFEPCGLTQMIALRYGSIPIVRKTGGLSDTIFDMDDENVTPSQKNGITFFDPQEPQLHSSLQRALSLYKDNPQNLKTLIMNGLSQDYSWTTSAKQYLEIMEEQKK
jgi:starch synthase